MNTNTSSLPSTKLLLILPLAIVKFLGFLPLGFRRILGRSLGYLYGLLPTIDRRVAIAQIDHFLLNGLTRPSAPEIFSSMGETLMETLDLSPLLENEAIRIKVSDRSILEKLCEPNRTHLCLTGHLGNWELFAAFLTHNGADLSAIGRMGRTQIFQEILAYLRKRNAVKTVWRTGEDQGSSNARELVALFKKPGIIGGLLDQDTAVSSVPIKFFGTPAATPSSLVDMALRFDTPIFCGAMMRQSDGSFFLELIEVPREISSVEVLGIYNNFLEEVIRRYPSQWVWFHKRWRTLPDGRRRSRSEYLASLSEKSHDRC